MAGFWFTVTSDEYGLEEFGPYDSALEAEKASDRVQAKAEQLDDGVYREYAIPYQKDEEIVAP
ncbi:hypothetical protein LCGC14_1393830 [marine sediment metagenome]|uniref:DUF1508 domain-containing protein n=1 Tax=marine sediment metagenome TaxID=412755 RepID=A0A0F9KJY7_9ZZZZ